MCGAKASRLCRGLSFSRPASLSSRRAVGGHVHGSPDALVGSTSTDVGHRLVDVFVGRLRRALKQCRGSHDLSGLAIAALGYVDRGPRLLHEMRSIGREPLNGDDTVDCLYVADANGAGALNLVVDVH